MQIDDEFGFLIDTIFEMLYTWTDHTMKITSFSMDALSHLLVEKITQKVDSLDDNIKWRLPILIQNLILDI